jgi:hypothetical protein
LPSVALFNTFLAWCLVFNASSCAFIISFAPSWDISSVTLGTYLHYVDSIVIDHHVNKRAFNNNDNNNKYNNNKYKLTELSPTTNQTL